MKIQNKRVLVTGANGFVAKHLIPRLSEIYTDVYVTTRGLNNTQAFDSKIHIITGDINNESFIKETIQSIKPHIVFHLAAYKDHSGDIAEFKSAIQTNLMSTLFLASALVGSPDFERIVALGSVEEYGNILPPFSEDQKEVPVSAYSFSKLCMTQLLQLFYRLYALPVVILRPSLMFGPAQANNLFMPGLILSLKESKHFSMTPGEQLRDFIYISDVIDALIAAATSQDGLGEVINIGKGQSVQLRELAEKIADLMGVPELLQIGARPYRNNELMEYVVDISKANTLLGWRPKVALDEGLKITIESYLA